MGEVIVEVLTVYFVCVTAVQSNPFRFADFFLVCKHIERGGGDVTVLIVATIVSGAYRTHSTRTNIQNYM